MDKVLWMLVGLVSVALVVGLWEAAREKVVQMEPEEVEKEDVKEAG
jgi:hypothetical protein